MSRIDQREVAQRPGAASRPRPGRGRRVAALGLLTAVAAAAAVVTIDRIRTLAATGTSPPATTTSPALRGCAVVPSSCGYPDATNSGVPSSVVLKAVPGQAISGPGWHWDTRGWVEIDGNGAVFEGYSVTSSLDVTAANVTIKNTRVTVPGENFGIALRHTSNATITATTITSPVQNGPQRLLVGIKDIYADSTGTRVIGNDISHTSTGVQMDAGLIQDSYIHDLGYTSGDHLNGITSNAGTNTMVIRHNTVFNQADQTDAISLFEDWNTVQANKTIDNNLVAGGGYTIYGGANPGGRQTSNIVVTNNRFARLYYPSSGYFGTATAFDRNGPGNIWAGNVWDDTGATVEG